MFLLLDTYTHPCILTGNQPKLKFITLFEKHTCCSKGGLYWLQSPPLVKFERPMDYWPMPVFSLQWIYNYYSVAGYSCFIEIAIVHFPADSFLANDRPSASLVVLLIIHIKFLEVSSIWPQNPPRPITALWGASKKLHETLISTLTVLFSLFDYCLSG